MYDQGDSSIDPLSLHYRSIIDNDFPTLSVRIDPLSSHFRFIIDNGSFTEGINGDISITCR